MMTEERLQYIAQHVAQWTFTHLVRVVGIEEAEARRAAGNAGDRAAQSLGVDLAPNP